jgi:Protein of unknown function, DUF417
MTSSTATNFSLSEKSASNNKSLRISSPSLRVGARNRLDRGDEVTGYEAKGIEPVVAHSPLLGWMYSIWTVRQLSIELGVVEVGITMLIACGLGRQRHPRSAVPAQC